MGNHRIVEHPSRERMGDPACPGEVGGVHGGDQIAAGLFQGIDRLAPVARIALVVPKRGTSRHGSCREHHAGDAESGRPALVHQSPTPPWTYGHSTILTARCHQGRGTVPLSRQTVLHPSGCET
ncbi:hypothetical protein GCM10023081_13240 [Arthrobacter ginkgonis]|uniref:Uncharacterized protein n=1 Tax=Arthrobacter ginkgonis TaxID=1630594 RepID=A0ABP7C150_9MICC